MVRINVFQTVDNTKMLNLKEREQWWYNWKNETNSKSLKSAQNTIPQESLVVLCKRWFHIYELCLSIVNILYYFKKDEQYFMQDCFA